jgi:hypothetical protein
MDLNVYLHLSGSTQLDRIETMLRTILNLEQKMSAELDALQAAVTNEDTVIDSAITLIQGLAAQIAANATDPAKLKALADDVNAKAQALAAAVAANTPASPTGATGAAS